MKLIRKLLFILAVCCFTFACEKPEILDITIYDCVLSEQIQETHPKGDELQALLDGIIDITPGIQVALTDKNGDEWTGAAGYADIPNEVMMEPCHKLMSGSISKVVTAAMVFQLQDEGVLNINDRLTEWLGADLLKDIPNADEVTLIHLLNHTSGIPDYLNFKQIVDSFNKYYYTLTQVEKLDYIRGEEAHFTPGEKFKYSNTNYVLLGLVIQEARGMMLWDVVQEYISESIGLENMVMGTEIEPVPQGTARPYFALNGLKYNDVWQYAHSDAATGDGGIISTAQDLNLFINGLFNGGLISEAALEEMTTNLILVGDDEADFDEWPEEAYGYGIVEYNTPVGKAYGHTGFTASYVSILFYFPENGATLSIAMNGLALEGSDGRIGELRNQLLEIIID